MRLLFLGLCCCLFFQSYSQDKFTLSGIIKDAANGEELIGATILVTELKSGTVSNVYGFYSLSLPAGTYHFKYDFIGYESVTKEIALTQNTKLNVELAIQAQAIQEVQVVADKPNKNVESLEMSTIQMKMESIKELPAFMGEVDVIKTIQLLPGVQSLGEASTGFYVRGGAVDQNLVLLDEAPVYNASHLLGFFSVFNSDAIKDLQLYKGGIPAEYGGRLSSVLDIRMKDGNTKKFGASGGIGILSSRLTIESPIKKGKGAFILSGRRTYADMFLKLSKDEDIKNNKLYFYDFNAKGNYQINENNRIYLSGYFGRDVFKFDQFARFSWGNITTTARWNHLFSPKLFSNITAVYSNFNYSLGADQEVSTFTWNSNIEDIGIKADLSYFPNPTNTIKFGVNSIYHRFTPGSITVEQQDSADFDFNLPKIGALEHALYISNDHKITARLSARYGIRYSIFQNIGKSTVYGYDEQFEVKDTTEYGAGKIFNTYGGFEPRLGLKYTLNETSSVKVNYNRMRQYLQLASNGTSSSPLDIWFPSSPNVKPQIADQIAAGYFKNFKNNTYEASLELYYKDMKNTVDFKNHAQLLLNPLLEGELRYGKARAYGAEILVRKQEGQFTGWVSYTLARTERNIKDIQPDWYPTKYDKTHDVSLVGAYQLSKRVKLGALWIYSTGAAVTMPTGRFKYRGINVPVYSDRNGARMPAYHRMDASITIANKPGKKWQSEWVISLFNVYGRKNAYSITFREDENDSNKMIAEKVYLFRQVPGITYNFKF